MRVLLLSLLSLSLSLLCVSGQSSPYPCTWTAPNGASYDFSSFRSDSGIAVPGSTSDLFDVNVCGPVQPQGNPACTSVNATVCMQYTWSPTWFALAEYNDAPAPTYSLIDPSVSQGGVQLTFTNGKYGSAVPTVHFQFLCGQNEQATYTAHNDGNNVWTITLTAAGACGSSAPPPSSNLPCTWTSPEGVQFDFSGLHRPQGDPFSGLNSDVYMINMCGPINGATESACGNNNASLCMQYTWSPNWFALAHWDMTPDSEPPAYSLIKPGSPSAGVQLTFNNGAYGPNAVQTSLQLMCGPNAEISYAPSHDNQFHWKVVTCAAQPMSAAYSTRWTEAQTSKWTAWIAGRAHRCHIAPVALRMLSSPCCFRDLISLSLSTLCLFF